MKIVMLKLSELHPAEKNVRMHPPEQIKEYKRSLEKYEQTKPIVIDEKNNILIGNGLYMAMVGLGWTEAACHIKAGLSEKEKKKLMMADNRIFNLGTDDLSVFDEFIAELDGDFDIPGYSDDLLNSLIMDSEEASEMLSEYGTIDEEEADSIRKANVAYEEPSEYEEIPNSKQAPQSVDAPDINVGRTREEASDRKFVVCPKCGEKIWL